MALQGERGELQVTQASMKDQGTESSRAEVSRGQRMGSGSRAVYLRQPFPGRPVLRQRLRGVSGPSQFYLPWR